MTGYVGRADGSPGVADLTPESLRILLLEATSAVEVDGQEPGVGARATRTDGEAWRVEVRTGGSEPGGSELRRTVAVNTEATFDLLRSWAADDGWWLEAFSWEPAGDAPD